MNATHLNMKERRFRANYEQCLRKWAILRCEEGNGKCTFHSVGTVPQEGNDTGELTYICRLRDRQVDCLVSHNDPPRPPFFRCGGKAQKNNLPVIITLMGTSQASNNACVFSIMSHCPFLMAGNLDKYSTFSGSQFFHTKMKSLDQGNLTFPFRFKIF